jgi:glycosyltransferase involved in cell wall biosynthesis
VSLPPLRILHLAVLPFGSATAWHAITLAKVLARCGHICWVAGLAASPVLRQAADEGLRLAQGLSLSPLRPWNWSRAICALRAFLITERVDVACVYTGSGHAELALARRGLPTALVRVRSDPRFPRTDRPHRWLYRRGSDLVAFSGEYMRQWCVAHLRLDPSATAHLPPGIDLAGVEGAAALRRDAARREVASRYCLPADLPLLAIIGRLSPVKGHAVLLRAAARLAEGGCAFRLLVVGDEMEVPVASLRALARSLRIEDRILFTGFVDDALQHAAAADVGIIASLGSEALSRSALEFMALAVPTVATRVGILPEIVACEELLVEPGEPEPLAAAIARLLGDPHRARRLGTEGRARVHAEYTFERLGERAAEIAHRAVARRRSATPRG